jgi:hypothetical protein
LSVFAAAVVVAGVAGLVDRGERAMQSRKRRRRSRDSRERRRRGEEGRKNGELVVAAAERAERGWKRLREPSLAVCRRERSLEVLPERER